MLYGILNERQEAAGARTAFYDWRVIVRPLEIEVVRTSRFLQGQGGRIRPRCGSELEAVRHGNIISKVSGTEYF